MPAKTARRKGFIAGADSQARRTGAHAPDYKFGITVEGGSAWPLRENPQMPSSNRIGQLLGAGAACLSMLLTPPALAAMGDLLKDNDPGGSQGDGRGLAFDGTYLYYTIKGDKKIYRMTTAGSPSSAAGTIGVPNGDPRVAPGGALAWDGSALWQASATSLVLYRVDPATGATVFSCNVTTANPGHPALPGLANPEGLEWSKGSLILTGSMSHPSSPQPNTVAKINPASCAISSWTSAPVGIGVAGFGTTGVASDGSTAWLVTPGGTGIQSQFFQTDGAGAATGAQFYFSRQYRDLAYDDVTFAPVCAIWAHEGSFSTSPTTSAPPPKIKKQHLSAFEVLCPVAPNVQPGCDAGGPYTADCDAGSGSIVLNGAGSFDPEGLPLSWSWTTDCAGGTLDDTTIPTPMLTATGPPACPSNCTVYLTVKDDAGASVSCSAPVTISDRTPPVINGPADLMVECSGSNGAASSDAGIAAWLGSATASDSCNSVTVDNDAPVDFPVTCGAAPTLVHFTATDSCGNTSMATASVGVVDTTPPALSVPRRIMIGCRGPQGIPAFYKKLAAHLGSAIGTDSCSAATVSNDAPAFFPINCTSQTGTAVTFTAKDECGNTTTGTTIIQVVDLREPVLKTPETLNVSCPIANPPESDPRIAAWLSRATSYDECSTQAPITTTLPPDLALCAPGKYTVIFKATDTCGNVETQKGTIRVTKKGL